MKVLAKVEFDGASIKDGPVIGDNCTMMTPEQAHPEAYAIAQSLVRHPTRKLSNYKRNLLLNAERSFSCNFRESTGNYIVVFDRPLEGAAYEVKVKGK